MDTKVQNLLLVILFIGNSVAFPFDKIGDRRVLVVKENANWHRANEICHSKGYDLLEIYNEEENRQSIELAAKNGFTTFWLGANSLGNGNFVWTTTGKELNFTAWGKGMPDNREKESCLHRWNQWDNKTSSELISSSWNDNKCSFDGYYFMCQVHHDTFWDREGENIHQLIRNTAALNDILEVHGIGLGISDSDRESLEKFFHDLKEKELQFEEKEKLFNSSLYEMEESLNECKASLTQNCSLKVETHGGEQLERERASSIKERDSEFLWILVIFFAITSIVLGAIVYRLVREHNYIVDSPRMDYNVVNAQIEFKGY